MKLILKLAGLALLAGLASAPGTALGTLGPCSGQGTTATGIVYGVCQTDQQAGTSTVRFSQRGLRVKVGVSPRRGTFVQGAFREQGPLVTIQIADVPFQICVSVRVTALRVNGTGFANHTLILSYDGVEHPSPAQPVTATGPYSYCGTVPPNASNIWWNLITQVGGTSPRGHTSLTEKLASAPGFQT